MSHRIRPAAARVLLAVTLSVSPVGADERPAGEAGERTLAGWITCEYCGEANANAAGEACVLACAGKGARLLLFSEDRLYTLSDQELAKKHVGYEVLVTGTIEGERELRVRRIRKKPSPDQSGRSSDE